MRVWHNLRLQQQVDPVRTEVSFGCHAFQLGAGGGTIDQTSVKHSEAARLRFLPSCPSHDRKRVEQGWQIVVLRLRPFECRTLASILSIANCAHNWPLRGGCMTPVLCISSGARRSWSKNDAKSSVAINSCICKRAAASCMMRIPVSRSMDRGFISCGSDRVPMSMASLREETCTPSE